MRSPFPDIPAFAVKRMPPVFCRRASIFFMSAKILKNIGFHIRQALKYDICLLYNMCMECLAHTAVMSAAAAA